MNPIMPPGQSAVQPVALVVAEVVVVIPNVFNQALVGQIGDGG
jgi:hypothetical protein